MMIFKDYHKKYFERLSWINALLNDSLNNKKVNKLINKLFKDGIFTILLFDNYSYFTGAIITRQKKKSIEVRCPKDVLDINDPVHWKTKGIEYFSRVKFVSSHELEKSKNGIVMMDIRHLLRIINSPHPIKTFVDLSYNGIIHTELPNSLWFFLRVQGMF